MGLQGWICDVEGICVVMIYSGVGICCGYMAGIRIRVWIYAYAV